MVAKDYTYQKNANVGILCRDSEYEMRKEVLRKLHDAFKKNEIKWGLAWGTSLFLSGIIDHFTDFDIIVEDSSIQKLKPILKSLGAEMEEKQNGNCFTTDLFLQGKVDGVKVDAMSKFSILGKDMNYVYHFSNDEIVFVEVENMQIPILCLEVEYILYYVLEVEWQPQRRHKRLLIQEYLINNGLDFRKVLERGLTEELPEKIKYQIQNLIFND